MMLLMIIGQVILTGMILFSNTLVILAVRRFPNLQTATNHFIVSLAIADLMVGLQIPIHIVLMIMPHWTHLQSVCLCRIVVSQLPTGVSVASLLLIAIDRHQAIVFPLHYRKRMTSRLVRKLICVSWALSIICTCLSNFAFMRDEPQLEQGCYIHSMQTPPAACLLFAQFVIVVLVMLVLYTHVFMVAYKHLHNINQMDRSERRTSQNRNVIRDTKTAKTLAIVIGVFIGLLLPFELVVFMRGLGVNTPVMDSVYRYSLPGFMINSCINPLIYAWRGTTFRTAFKCLLRINTSPRCRHSVQHRI